MVHEELNKKRDFQKGYKHNVEILRKNRAKAKYKMKMCIKKLQDENEEFKGSTTQLKSQNEELQDLKQKAKIWETRKRKWTQALFLHKKQHEALDSQVKALTEEKKEKENFLINLELINLKNVSLLQFKELRRKIIEVEKEKLIEDNKY